MSDSQPRRRRIKPWMIKLAVVVLFVFAIIIPLGREAYYRAHCGAAAIVSSSYMRQVATEHSLDASAGEPLRSVGLMCVDRAPEFDQILRGMCFSDSPSDVVILGHTLKEIRSRKLDSKDLLAMAIEPTDEQSWEPLGRFRFTREMKAFNTYNSHLIVSLSCYEGSSVLVGFADIHVESVYSRSDLQEIIELDRTARFAHELPPSPIDHLQEIDDYRARKGLPPFTD